MYAVIRHTAPLAPVAEIIAARPLPLTEAQSQGTKVASTVLAMEKQREFQGNFDKPLK
jgi:hypothetical protein